MKVCDLMHKGIEIMPPDTPVTKLANKMREKDIGAIPVGSNGQLVGMVTDRDIIVRAVANGKDLSQLTAQDVMTNGVTCCRDTDKVRDVLNVMEEKQIRRVPVTDEDDKVVGIVSIGDISAAMSGKAAGEVMKAVSAHHR
jgi:CBS domain-containing protein